MVDKSVSPYFDDYDISSSYHQFLFRPGVSVQVRELNGIQTMLQRQIEQMGSHVFENGSLVIPGEVNYELSYQYITVTGLNYSTVVNTLNSAEVELVGVTSGTRAVIVQHKPVENSDPVTFYVRYTKASAAGVSSFSTSESIQLRVDGATFATATFGTDGAGSVLTIEEGIWYVNGYFVQNTKQRVVLSKYSTTPSVVVGFDVIETAVGYVQDPSLVDNANGTTNENAPGADRLKITLQLAVHGTNDVFDRTNFVEIARFENGNLLKLVRGPEYNVLEDVLASRTYDESGDYTVDPFGLRVREHLRVGNNDGLYPAGDEAKLVYGVESGKAYVRGYKVENLGTIHLESTKARQTGFINNSTISLPLGNYITLTAANITPTHNQFQQITFYSGAVGTAGNVPAGSVLGTARVRFCQQNFGNNRTVVYVFDIRNAAGNPDSSFIKDARSVYAAGSTGFTGTLFGYEFSESVNTGLVYELPADNVKTLLVASQSDTSITVARQYSGTTDASGNIILTAGANEVFVQPSASSTVASYTITGTSTIRDISGISTLGGAPIGRTLTIAFGAGVASRAVTINVEVVKQIATSKSKTRTSTSVTLTPAQLINGRFSLGKADAIVITAITENSVNRLNSYTLNKNITSEYYGVSFAQIKAGEQAPAANTTINFDYFVHGAGDFFSADSYANTPYKEIPIERVNGVDMSMADVIDFRPRMSDDATGFSAAGSSFTDVPRPNSLLRCDITHYLPRIDKVFVTSKGRFGVVNGVASVNPVEPQTPDNAMAIYTVFVPAYTRDIKDVQVRYINNRRYTMRDIGALDERISRTEYYATLNALELETASMQIVDAVGANRFKNGFIVDNFVDHSVGAYTLGEYRCAISREDATLRPEFYSDSVSFAYNAGLSTGVAKTGSLITLPYTQSTYFSQPLASGKMNVNPYAVYLWYGEVKLNPSSDFWFDTVYTSPEVTQRVMNNGNLIQEWNSWQVNWAGSTAQSVSNNQQVTTTQRVVGERVVDESVVPFMRSRDVAFIANGLLPSSRIYAMFDNVDVTANCRQNGKNFGDPMITDVDGKIEGVFRVPNTDALKFRTGMKQFTLIDAATGNKGDALTYGDAFYTARGTLQTRTQSIVATANITNRVVNYDPLAQSFLVDKAGGVYVTSIDLFFASKDKTVPVMMEIRNVVNGYPGQDVVPYSRKTLKPSEVNVSGDASLATRFTFDSPVYLLDGQEYCFVVMSNCNNYEVYIGTMGQKQIGTNTYISKQPFIGVMFKSQNNTAWTADQMSDMKFNLQIANFTTNVQGNAVFVSDKPVQVKLAANPIVSTNASTSLTVVCNNHGQMIGSRVAISGVTGDHGVPLAQINTSHTVVSVLDADRFTVTVAGAANRSGAFGGDAVMCDRNLIVNTVMPVAAELLFENTNIDWSFDGYSARSIDGTETPYTVLPSVYVEPNRNNDLSVPFVVPSATDCTHKSITNPAKLTARMISYSSNISPAIDVERLGIVGIANRVNNPVSLSETASTGGNAIARYITNPIGLKLSAKALKVFADVSKPQGADVIVYYRTGNSSDELNNKGWTVLPSIVSTVATGPNVYNEFEYGVNDIPAFGFCQFKVVLLSTSSSSIPRVKRFRGITLGT